jgi:hypothetical protein
MFALSVSSVLSIALIEMHGRKHVSQFGRADAMPPDPSHARVGASLSDLPRFAASVLFSFYLGTHHAAESAYLGRKIENSGGFVVKTTFK